MLRTFAFSLALLLSGQAVAQTAGVPGELLENNRRQNGDQINVCFDTSSVITDFDHDVAQAIGDALFLQINVSEGFGGFPVNGDGFMDELQLAMSNTCDVFMGASVQTNSPFPEWAAVTRPYATIPFVLAVQDTAWNSWADIPHDRKIGTAMQSLGELAYITWSLQQPEAERWKRLPYVDISLMAKRVQDGSLGGMLLWQPALRKLQNEQPDAAAFRVIDLAPVPETTIKVGAVVSSRDAFLRNQVDQTIDALVADGTIQALMDKHGYTGHQGD